MRMILLIFGLLAVVLVAAFSFYRWDEHKNRGWEIGYYGEFNTVSNMLAGLPAVSITNSWCNHEMKLDNFGFEITTADGRPVQIHVRVNSPLRKMSGDKLKNALLAEINAQRSAREVTK